MNAILKSSLALSDGEIARNHELSSPVTPLPPRLYSVATLDLLCEQDRRFLSQVLEVLVRFTDEELKHQELFRLLEEFTGRQPSTNPEEDAVATIVRTLTERERAALRLLCAGRTNAQIAWELGIAEKTARNHISNIYRKLGVRSRAEAIVLTHGNRRLASIPMGTTVSGH